MTKINAYTFIENNIKNLILPEGLTEIGTSSFRNNQISDLIIPSSVTNIGSSAFNNNQLPDSQAFIYARNEDGTINNTILISYGGANKDVIIPDNVNIINPMAFTGVGLNNINIHNAVTYI